MQGSRLGSRGSDLLQVLLELHVLHVFRVTAQRAESILVLSRRRPVVLRGAASQLAPTGGALWNLDLLPALIPEGRVRVSPDATFIFCKESHPLCESGAFPPPSLVCPRMSGAEFVQRVLQPHTEPLRPLFFGAGERYYMQADVPPSVLDPQQVPSLWRALGVAQAQPLRLWVSTAGAVTPLHFDACASFLAQMRGEKRIVFFPPSALPGLYPYPIDHPMHRRGRVSLYACPEERDVAFPRFAEEAAPHAEVVTLSEGDCVLFPEHWWHHIETVSPLSCSVGCRYVG